MRDLFLMRGVPGSGKSTFIKENNLEPYTICPDNIRLMFESPVVDPQNGMLSISQKNDKEVWKLVNKLVETKMNRGEFIVIDAMNINVSRWKKLAEKYRYRIRYKNFDVPVYECIIRNNNREDYKKVPEEVIINAYKRMQETIIPKYAKEAKDDFFNGIKPLDVNEYENIYVFGDIHGCFDPVDQFFKEHPFSNKNLYVFCGDFLDRGPKNKETLEFFMQFTENKNMMFLEGNHHWEKYWANDEINEIRSKEFLINTINQINDVDKAKVRDWCRRWIQMAYLEYDNKKYFITHAGFGFFPKEKFMRFIPSYDMIKGGKYEDDVDAWYEEKNNDVIQIHGHRNIYEYPADKFKTSFNLNSAVEFGEPLRIMHIFKSGHDFLYYENESCKGKTNPWKQYKQESNNIALYMSKKKDLTEEEQFVMNLRKSKDIIEKPLANHISSFNFKKNVFYTDRWNDLNKIARGLFIDLDNCKIVARSYEKFFNYEEGDKNTSDFLEQHLQFPITGYLKYNGFLGLMSYDHKINDLHFFSKSTDSSDFAGWFKEIVLNQFKNIDEIKNYLKNNDVTMVFEVIDPINDPHIIEYNMKQVILLDIVNNKVVFHKKSYDELCKIANELKMKVKTRLVTFQNYHDLKSYLDDNNNIVVQINKPIEGIVFEDTKGYMFKYKMDYYLFWKKMRGVKQQIQKGMPYGLNKIDKKGMKVADFMKNNFTIEELQNMSIIDVRNKFESSN